MGEAAELASAMDRLWAKFLPQIQERVFTLQKAAEKLINDSLSEEDRRRASADAHKLAGVLGTFGLQHGSELAREAEGVYGSSTLDRSSTVSNRLTQIAEQLSIMITNRK